MKVKIDGSRVLGEMLATDKRIIVNRGGTRSTKTYSAMQLAALWLITGNINENWNYPKGVLSVVRKTLPSLKASAKRDFEEIMWKSGYMPNIQINKSELTYTNGERTVEFFSVDNQQKVRSRKRTILIAIEANELDFRNDFNQLALRTTDRIILDFNPDDEDIWINTEMEQKRAVTKQDVKVIVSTYKDNHFLDPETVAEIEYLEETDEELWQVFGKGEYGKVTGLIFPNVHFVSEFPEGLPIVIYGLDFGYNDPQALVKVGILEKSIWLEELYYERFKTNQDFINNFLAESEIERTDTIYADSARPGSIQEIYNAGYRGIIPSKKGTDSVRSGLTFLKGFKIHIVGNSENLKSERRKYKWMTDKNGNPIEGKPIDKYNHAMDAMRYAVFTHLYKPERQMRIA